MQLGGLQRPGSCRGLRPAQQTRPLRPLQPPAAAVARRPVQIAAKFGGGGGDDAARKALE
ncbi:hypothetical protein MNEG_14914, partial [Monoraphidium neglectum]